MCIHVSLELLRLIYPKLIFAFRDNLGTKFSRLCFMFRIFPMDLWKKFENKLIDAVISSLRLLLIIGWKMIAKIIDFGDKVEHPIFILCEKLFILATQISKKISHQLRNFFSNFSLVSFVLRI